MYLMIKTLKFWNSCVLKLLTKARSPAKMDILQTLIFALIGAVTVTVIVGGGSALVLDDDASYTSLGIGAGVGAGLGSVVASLLDTSVLPKTVDVKTFVQSVMKGGADPEMRVGLPAF